MPLVQGKLGKNFPGEWSGGTQNIRTLTKTCSLWLYFEIFIELIGDSYVVEVILKMFYKALVGMDCSGCCTVQ